LLARPDRSAGNHGGSGGGRWSLVAVRARVRVVGRGRARARVVGRGRVSGGKGRG